MSLPLKAISAAIALALMPTLASAQSAAGTPPTSAQPAQLDACRMMQSMWLINRRVNDVDLPYGARIIGVHSSPAHNFDARRLNVVTSRYGVITNLYCG